MKHLIKHIGKIVALLFGFYALNTNGQSNIQILESEYNNSGQLFSVTPHPSWSKASLEQMPKLLSELYGVSDKFTFRLKNEEVEEKYTFTRVEQMIGDYPVVEGEMIFKRDKSGSIQVIIGILKDPEYISLPLIDDKKALDIAKTVLNISEKDYFVSDIVIQPKIELKYAAIDGINTNRVTLCYEVIISTQQPAYWFVYVNARTGKIEYQYNGMQHADGKGTTLYSGQKNINTMKVAGGYALEDSARKIITRNFRNIPNTNVNAPNGGHIVRDPNNNFDSTEQKYAVDAHWGMAVTYDYYLNTLKRKSYDGKGGTLVLNVRWDKDYNNAFFSPATNQMYFGKQDGVFGSDNVALDVVGHEFSHSLINATANLTYRGESGALNESFADIFGHCVEALGKGVNWALFEETFTPGTANDAMRYMDDPNKSGNSGTEAWLHCPDTYKGTYWKNTADGYDEGGVHFNSGVQNFWFYLLTVGGNGTNDAPLNHSYSVSGIGQTKSEQIAYRALTKYLGPSSDYKAARKASLLAAEDLHGKKSNEYKQVCNAWYAVGVGEKCCEPDDYTLTFNVTDTKCHDSKDGEIELKVKKLNNNNYDSCTYKWYKGDTTSAVLATTRDLFNRDSGRYIVIVKDTVAKCEIVDKTNIKSPEKVKVAISGGGEHKGACQRSITIVITASASGGTSPYTYNWANARQEIVMSGSSGFARDYTAIGTDKNGCQAEQTAEVIYIPVTCSYDPNDIIGPPSYGDSKWVSINATLPYKIRYENDPKFATGPAQKVTINHKLDTNTDLTSFRVSNFGFYKYSFEVPENSTTYSKRLNLRDSFGIYLDVTAGLDLDNREAFWIFESIDPATGLPPTDGSKGYLAINDTITHKGEGFVNYTIKPKSTSKTGDSIRAKATIVFDDNTPVPTPRIFNLIDAKPPVTYIKTVPAIIDSTIVTMTLRGKDDTGGSGMGNFDIYVSENGGVYNRYASDIADTIINFRGNYGSSYTAYTIGSDNVENREADKTTPDISFDIASKEFFKPIPPSTSLCSGDTLRVRWLRSVINSINLQYSADSGQTYTTFAGGLAGTDTLYRWKIPSNINGIKNYYIIAVNANNSLIIDTTNYFELKQGPAISLGPDTSFCDGTSFSLNLNPGGGYTSYKWSDSSTTTTKTVTTYGTYGVVVTASTGCKSMDEINVTKDFLPVVSSKTLTPPLCFGNINGAIDITVVSGSAPYTYLWNNAVTTQDLTNIGAGTYSVIITDLKGCIAKDTSVLTQPDKLVLTHAINHVKCFGGSDGSVNVTITGGTTPYSYSWSNASTSEDINSVTAATYYLEVNDKNNCVIRDTAMVTQPTKLAKSKTQVNVLCYGGSTGSIDLTITGGTTGYTYAWTAASGGSVPSGQATNQDLTGLVAGTYYVTVTDANNCIIKDTAIITQPNAALSNSFTQVNVVCYGGTTGSVNLTAAGGTSPYTYAWTGPTSFSATTEDISGLAAGTYDVVITDANGTTGGCRSSNSITITQPNAPVSSTFTQTNVVCYGGTTGAINLTPAGGTTPYTFAWTGPGSFTATTEDISGLVAGTYNLVITDANGTTGGCRATNSVTITQPSAPVSSTFTQVNIVCNGGTTGSINLTPSGGTTPYTFAWTGPGSFTATTEDISSLAAGTYNVVITDANGTTGGCRATNSVNITQPSAPVSSTFTSVNVACYGGSTGSINLTPAGGTSPYTFAWTGPGSYTATTEDISGLAPGTYNVVITDANGTTGGCRATNSVVITQPSAAVSSSFTQVNVVCNGGTTGSINLTPTGGTTPYTFAWTGPGSFSATTEDISSLAAGTYNVTITDANGTTGGCRSTNSVTITQPSAAVSSTFTQVNVVCNGGTTGSINLTPSGGTSPYTFAWTGPGSFTANTEDISSLAAGTYNVVITDANGTTGGCRATNSVTITQPSAAVTSTFTQVNVVCNGGTTGSIDLTPAGGTTPYTFAWTGPGTFTANTEDISGLSAGTYNVVITDANGTTGGCRATNSVTMTQPSAPVSSTFTQTNVLCNGGTTGSINLTPAGGTTPYTFAWTGPGTFTATTEDISTLAAGTYNVVITDANGTTGGCRSTNSVTITQPTALIISNIVTDVKCFGENNGGVNVTISGGVTPYGFSWTSGANSEDISNVIAGSYTLTVTDNNGCVIQTTGVVNQPALLVASHVISDVKCYNGSDGAIDLTIAGGITPYTYAWSSSDITEDISGKPTGTYKVTVTDKNLCVVKDSGLIGQPLAPLASAISMSPVNCYAGNDGSADLTVTGGTTPYTFAWSNGKTTEDISDLILGTYYVTITDANNCQLLDTVVVTQPAAPLATGITKLDVKCFGGNDGSADLTVTGGTMPYNFSWSNSANTEDITGLILGKYVITVTDINLCIIRDSVIIAQPAAPLSSTISATAVKCFAGNDGGVTLNVAGGTLNYSYLWSNGAITKDITGVITGKYKVTVTDGNNCILKDSIVVSQPVAPLSATHTVSNAKCKNSLDGNINLTVAGGTSPYTYAWSNGQTTEDAVNLGDGHYVVTITDANSCKLKDSADITEPDTLLIAADGTTATSGDANGFVFVGVSGGTLPYSFMWNGNAAYNNDSLMWQPTGIYIIRVVDGNGCTQFDTFEILEAPAVSLLRLGPNPSNGILTVYDLEAFGLDLPIYFELWDLEGKMRMKFDIIGKDIHTFRLDDSLYNNAYMLRIYNDRFEETRKVYLLR